MQIIEWSKDKLQEVGVTEDEVNAITQPFNEYSELREKTEGEVIKKRMEVWKQFWDDRSPIIISELKKRGVDFSEIEAQVKNLLELKLKYQSNILEYLSSLMNK